MTLILFNNDDDNDGDDAADDMKVKVSQVCGTYTLS